MRKRSARITVLAVALLGRAEALRACPVCFGQSDSQMAQGTNWAILFLLAVTGAVLFGFVSFFVHVFKRSRMAIDEGIELPKSVHQGETC